MGRSRVDAYGTAQFKRPTSSSRRELYGQSQVPESGLGRGGGGSRSRSLSTGRGGAGTSDAKFYLKEVKDTFLDQMEKYNMFLDVMMDFKNQRIDTGGVVARVKDLFKGHPSLILGFQPFLPKGYEITLNDDDESLPTKSVEFEQAICLVNKIKKRFRNADHVYKSFLAIVCSHRKEKKDTNEVYHEVSVLLNDHPDLLDEFTNFLLDKKSDNENNGDLRMQHHTDEKKSVRKFEEFGGPREDKNALKYTYSQEPTFCEKVKERLRSPADYRSFLKYFHYYSNERITRKELQSLVSDILEKYPDLMEGFNEFIEHYERVAGLPADEVHTNPKLVKEEQKEQKCKIEAPPKDAINFLKKVKERFQNDDHAYESFLDIIKAYKEECKSLYEVYHEVAKFLNDHPDLLDEFTKFLPNT